MKLGPQHTAFAFQLIANGGKIKEASDELGIVLSTARHWARQPEFASLLEKLQEKVYETLVDRLKEEKGELKSRLDSAQMDSLNKLIELRDSAGAEAVQRLCAVDLLKGGGTFESERGAVYQVNISTEQATLINTTLEEVKGLGKVKEVKQLEGAK